MPEHRVIISGHRADLHKLLEALKDGVQQSGNGFVHVKGNGEPDLLLEFSVEEADEFTEPVADCSMRH